MELFDLIADLSLEDAVAHFVTLCWDAGILVSVDDVEVYVLDLVDTEDDPDDWAEERGTRLLMLEAL